MTINRNKFLWFWFIFCLVTNSLQGNIENLFESVNWIWRNIDTMIIFLLRRYFFCIFVILFIIIQCPCFCMYVVWFANCVVRFEFKFQFKFSIVSFPSLDTDHSINISYKKTVAKGTTTTKISSIWIYECLKIEMRI